MTEHHPQTLWVPDQAMTLDHEYPVPTTSELAHQWNQYLDDPSADTIPAPDIYGTLRVPDSVPDTFLSVDLCEVVRQTHASLRTVEEPFGTPIDDINDYCAGMKTVEGHGYKVGEPRSREPAKRYQDIKSIAQVMIDGGHIMPVEGIDEIASLMQAWRKLGIYVLANTSTLEGCEPGTVRFLQRHLSGAFDGIVFPRNFDGNGKITKGAATRSVIEAFGTPGTSTTAIHIDDLGHHLDAFHAELQAMPDITIKTFQPLYSSTVPHPLSTHGDSPISVFRMVDAYFGTEQRTP